MSERQHISLYELQLFIKKRLTEAMPLPCWVTAEISELKVNYSGHCYVELVEKGGDNQVPKAKVSAMIWSSRFGLVSHYFRSATGGDLAEGMKVLVKATVNYHELYGMSLVISDIDPLYTLGDMEHQRQQTIARLEQDGVYDMNRSLELPRVIQRIAVVSSANAAGYQDFMSELEASDYKFSVTLFDAFMQGHAAEQTVIEALNKVADALDDFDVVVVIRGGGSQSDLAAFDSYRLCSHIAQFPIPVIVGIGHDKDQSVADLVAAVALKTPTAVATYLISALYGLDALLDDMQREILRVSVAILDGERRRLQATIFSISNVTSTFRHTLEMRLERLSNELIRGQEGVIARAESVLSRVNSLLSARAERIFTHELARLNTAYKVAQSRSPESILALGFSIVRRTGAGGTVVKSAEDVSVGEQLEVSFSSGVADVKVERVSDK